MPRLAITSVAICMLAACSGEAEAPNNTADNSKAEGEVLGGSVSDAMLPLDQLQSQSSSIDPVPTAPAPTDDNSGDQAAPAEPATFEQAFGATGGNSASEGTAAATQAPAQPPQPSE